ncbi:MAG: phosphatase PAP2 family protein [Deltaproteobacteria bacterium]|uniref:Phosphatase PAP2 family protein n=1 Tax=Candidatus Zymogenus saltonus TaxID=2844893 RepID=A0A9D8KI24_9DELT|nr:phosphatase PAP2 family protein [Candidatus Zymogenus saltonus]
MADRLYGLDLSIFYLINHGLKSPLLDKVLPYFSDFEIFVIPLVILAIFALIKWRLKALWVMLILGAAIGLTDTISFYGIKSLVARPRPYHVLDNVNLLKEWGYSSSFSFPSSHSANSFAIATVLGWFYPKTTFILIPAALMVALSRVYGGVHYPSDVLGGAALGVLCASAALFVSGALKAKWEDSKAVGRVTGDEGHFVLYNLLAPLALLYYIPRLMKEKEGRRGFRERFGHINIPAERPLWIHAASVGEVMVARALIESLRRKVPDLPVLLTVNTPAGRLTAERTIPEAFVSYFPFDFPWIVRRALKKVSPVFVVLTEAEIWPNFIRIAKKRGIPVVLVNGRMSERTHRRFTMIGAFSSGVLGRLSAVVSQSEGYRERYIDLGCQPDNVHVSGNVKYDMLPEHKGPKGDLKDFISRIGRKIVLAGSTHRGEEEIVLDAVAGLGGTNDRPFLIVAPRHLNRVGEVEELLKSRDLSYIKRTEIVDGSKGLKVSSKDGPDVLLLDTIGELSSLMGSADVVFIGGSLIKGIGGHNVLEAAAVKKAPLFGPHMGNFPEISRDLVDAEGGFVVSSAGEMAEIAGRMMADADFALRSGERAASVIERNRGATERCIELLMPFIKGSTER